MKQLNRGSLLDATRQKLWSLDSHLCIRNSRRRRIDYLSESLTWDWAEFLILSRGCWIWGLLVPTWIIIHLFIDSLAKILFKKYLPMGKGGGQRIAHWLKHPIESLTFRKLGNSQGASHHCTSRPLWPLPPKTQTCSKPKETQRYLPSMCFHFGRCHIKNRRWFPKGSVWLVWKKGAFHWLDLDRAGALKACHSGSWT